MSTSHHDSSCLFASHVRGAFRLLGTVPIQRQETSRVEPDVRQHHVAHEWKQQGRELIESFLCGSMVSTQAKFPFLKRELEKTSVAGEVDCCKIWDRGIRPQQTSHCFALNLELGFPVQWKWKICEQKTPPQNGGGWGLGPSLQTQPTQQLLLHHLNFSLYLYPCQWKPCVRNVTFPSTGK